MTEQDAKELAIKSIRSASLRDSFSGDGIDVLVINNEGSKMTSEKIN
jgi:proteasome beta subunit